MASVSTVTISGAPEGYDARLVLRELEACTGPVIHVARDDKRLAAMVEALRLLDPGVAVLVLPGWDCLP
ncbi:MAG: hypothetical protein WBN44_12810, partial [Woeseiaceae bacterium]